MLFIKDSFTIVLLGDWNHLYMQPQWIADNVYEKNEIEIGINGQGVEYQVTFRGGGIVIAPTQSQVAFTAKNIEADTLSYMLKCVNNFLHKATTPTLSAYGFNCEYCDNDGGAFAEVVDSISDNNAIFEQGYEIKASRVTRTLVKDEKELNFDARLEDEGVIMHFNEHHGDELVEMPTIESAQIESFLSSCEELIKAFGYELEGDE